MNSIGYINIWTSVAINNCNSYGGKIQ